MKDGFRESYGGPRSETGPSLVPVHSSVSPAGLLCQCGIPVSSQLSFEEPPPPQSSEEVTEYRRAKGVWDIIVLGRSGEQIPFFRDSVRPSPVSSSQLIKHPEGSE